MSVFDKLDAELSLRYARHLNDRASSSEEGAASTLIVSLRYTGRLEEIEPLGFRTKWDDGRGRASGTVDLNDLERITGSPHVFKLSLGPALRPALNVSVPSIRADEVRSWDSVSKLFTGTTGDRVIVGIIDTGIDFTHAHFVKRATELADPAKPETRILRIWDQGLDPTAGEKEKSPLPSMLEPDVPGTAETYGVEYDENRINQVLQNTKPASWVRHHDTEGHGTTVASVAAGNGQPDFFYIGVAPEASLVIVKYLGFDSPVNVDGSTRLRHAVNYILSVASDEDRPVVINLSATYVLGPHDGFTEDETFLAGKFKKAVGAAFVVSAGNHGHQEQHATFSFLPGGKKTIKIAVRSYNEVAKSGKQATLGVDIYFPGGAVVIESSALTIPVLAGPISGADKNNPTKVDGLYTMTLSNDDALIPNDDPLLPDEVIPRTCFTVRIDPEIASGRHPHNELYVLELEYQVVGAGTVRADAWCFQQPPIYGLRFEVTTTPEVTIEDRFEIGEPAGARNIFSVAAYDPLSVNNPKLLLVNKKIWKYSSPGPLVDYRGPQFQPDHAPFIAAPGVDIDAAESCDGAALLPLVFNNAINTVDGTSFAAPHVAGVIALMLQQDRTLTASQIAEALILFSTEHANSVDGKERCGHGWIDAKEIVDNIPLKPW